VHIPVLLSEILESLDVRPNRNYVDGTLGEGGHAKAILKQNAPTGKVLGLDWDASAIRRFRKSLEPIERERVTLVNGNFADVRSFIQKKSFWPVHGILFDLGMSSVQLEASGRGFSFLGDEKLDMRFSTAQRITAGEIVNAWSLEALEGILRDYGEESFAREIAETIVRARKDGPIRSTHDLVGIIKAATPRWYRMRRLNPATKTFQALRMAVNGELANIESALPESIRAMVSGGRLAVISFHSLEDRIVKNFFRERAKAGEVRLVTPKPIRPGFQEVRLNPRARSARLRVLEKT
jgi:16S rRNA (cytosine1402-N4)-methyltransferase